MPPGTSSAPDGYTEYPFTADGATRRVFTRGQGPAVVIMHEIPGLSPQCLALGGRVAEAGFTVFLPLLFGEPGQHANWFGSALRLCMVDEFKAYAADESQPITSWMRALCTNVNTRTGSRGVGLVGLCLTGGLVFALIAEQCVRAAVASEPALPIPFNKAGRDALGISPVELADARGRVRANHTPSLGLRFSNDWICPKERFARIEHEFGTDFTPIEIDSTPGNAAGIPPHAHAVLTDDFVDQPGHPTRAAYDRVITFLRGHLG